MRIPRLLAAAVMAVCLCTGSVRAEGERKEIPTKYTWNLTDLYPTRDAWTAARTRIEKRVHEMQPFKGHLGDSPQTLLKALLLHEEIAKELARLGVYAMLSHDTDTREAATQSMVASVQKLENDFATSNAFFDPEVLSIGSARVADFLKKEPGLVPFKPVLDDILRKAPHTLSPAEERVAARWGEMADAPQNIYSIIDDADLPFPTVQLPDGKKVRLDQAGYGRYRSSENRDVRLLVFREFFKTYDAFKRTFGTTLFNQVKAHVVNKDLRNYASSMAAALNASNVPTTVYRQLITDVNANLPTLHRYLRLRQRMLGVEHLRYEDLYAPIVKAVDMHFTPEQAMDLTLKAVAPLGPEYVATLKKAYEDRWVDFLPSTGKRSGAYSVGDAYDVHPYQLLNFNGAYDDVSTLAHESGHSMHSWYSNKHQRFANSNYSIFVAEVASTLNEDLLFHSEMARAKDDATRLYLLGERLETYRTTLFRQVLFAEYEARIHDMVEKGEPLTGELLSKTYLALARHYYGHAGGVCQVDDLYGVEWAFVPHFYYNFYVYQYATSLMASATLADRIRTTGAPARDAYLRLLSAGSSKYPVDLLKDAGVDMTTSTPFQTAMKEMNTIMDQIESILKKQGR